MPQIIFELTDTEAMVLEHIALDPLDFIENIVTWQARIAIDELAEAELQIMLADPTVSSIPATKEELVSIAINQHHIDPLNKESI